MKSSHRFFLHSAFRSLLIASILCLLFTVPAVSATVVTAKLNSEFYFLGDEIELSGTSTSGEELDFIIDGTNFEKTSISNCLTEKTFGKNWYVKISTDEIISSSGAELDAGVYRLSILEGGELVAELPITFVLKDAELISVISSPSIVSFDITEVVVGNTIGASEVQYYIFGPNYFTAGTAPAPSFKINIPLKKDVCSPGDYYMVIQHPMQNGTFEFYPKGNQIWLNTDETSFIIFDVFESYKTRSPEDASNALIAAFESQQNSDDTGKLICFTVPDTSDIVPDTPPENLAYTDITITPSGNIYVGQTIVGTFIINIPAGSVNHDDMFSFSSPLEYAKWHLSVYDSSDNLMMEEGQWHSSSPDFPYQMNGFIASYHDRDIKLKVSFKGKVPQSSLGSSINVIRVDSTASAIGSYISPSQMVKESLHSAYTDVIITPSGSLEAGQTVTGTLNISITANSDMYKEIFSFSSPLESAKWYFKVYNSSGYLYLTEVPPHESSPEEPYQRNGFFVDYDEDMILNVNFVGKVSQSSQGSYINVVDIDCTSPLIGSYLSPGQPVLPLSPPEQEQSAEFYGTVKTTDGTPIPANTEIVALVGGKTFSFIVTEDGKLGGSNSDDKNLIVSGVPEGSLIRFKIGDVFAAETSSFNSGSQTEIALTFSLDIKESEINGDKTRIQTAVILAPNGVTIPDNIQVTVQESSDVDKTTHPTTKPDKTNEFKIYEISIPEDLNGFVTISIDIFISTDELNKFFGGDSSLIRVYHGKNGVWQMVKIVNISQVTDGIIITINANDFSPYMIAADTSSKDSSQNNPPTDNMDFEDNYFEEVVVPETPITLPDEVIQNETETPITLPDEVIPNETDTPGTDSPSIPPTDIPPTSNPKEPSSPAPLAGLILAITFAAVFGRK